MNTLTISPKAQRDPRGMTVEDLEKLSTKRLLNIKRLAYNFVFMPEDWVRECTCDECLSIKESLDKTEKFISKVKSILDTREHIIPKKRGKKA